MFLNQIYLAEYDILEEWRQVRASCKKRLDKLQKEEALKLKLEQNENKSSREKTRKEGRQTKVILQYSII